MISKVDCFGIDRPTLSYKIIKRIENNQYILGSKFEIINVYYSFRKIKPFGIQYFFELNNLSSNKISVREVVYLQSIRLNTSVICNCKHNCNNNKCSYKKKEAIVKVNVL